MSTDHDWEKWGETDPYYGVFSSEKYRHRNLTEQSKAEFFQSGEKHVAWVFETIHRVFDKEFMPNHSLDFGCGVGRLVIPLSKRCRHVIGVDVSTSMLAEADKNCAEHENIKLALADEVLQTQTTKYDLVHSYIVFQHIPSKRGMRIIEQLMTRVNQGGILVIHFIYRCNAPKLVRFMVRVRYALPIINKLRNILMRNPVTDPPMQMHAYSLEGILNKAYTHGYTNTYQAMESWDNGNFDVTTLFAHRRSIEST